MEQWKGELERRQAVTWVVEDVENQSLAAYLVAWRVLCVLEVVEVAVAPAYRRQGVASILFETLKAISTVGGISKILLEVRVSNREAIEFYRDLGFRITARHDGFYADDEAAFSMGWPPGEG